MWGQIDDIIHTQEEFTLKKTINHKLCIQIKFQLHHYLFHDKIFKTRPHFPIFVRYLNIYIFLVLNN